MIQYISPHIRPSWKPWRGILHVRRDQYLLLFSANSNDHDFHWPYALNRQPASCIAAIESLMTRLLSWKSFVLWRKFCTTSWNSWQSWLRCRALQSSLWLLDAWRDPPTIAMFDQMGVSWKLGISKLWMDGLLLTMTKIDDLGVPPFWRNHHLLLLGMIHTPKMPTPGIHDHSVDLTVGIWYPILVTLVPVTSSQNTHPHILGISPMIVGFYSYYQPSVCQLIIPHYSYYHTICWFFIPIGH